MAFSLDNAKWAAFIAVFIKLFLGSVDYVVIKTISQDCDAPTYAIEHKTKGDKCPPGQLGFHKPIFVNTVLFLAMSLAMVIYAGIKIYHGAKVPRLDRKTYMALVLPALIEFVGLCLSTSAQMIIKISLAMLFKGSRIVFSAILTVLVLRRRLWPFQWAGVAIAVSGVALASFGAISKADGVDSEAAIGIALSLSAELTRGLRVVVEEGLLHGKKLEPVVLVGFEGIYCLLLSIPAILLCTYAIPGKEGGHFEDISDTFHRIGRSQSLMVLLPILPLMVCVVTVAGAYITKLLSAVHNSLISVLRTAVVWPVMLMIHAFGSKSYGEEWDSESSHFQLVGYLVIIFGTVVFDGCVRLNFLFKYPKERRHHRRPMVSEKEVSEKGIEGSSGVTAYKLEPGNSGTALPTPRGGERGLNTSMMSLGSMSSDTISQQAPEILRITSNTLS